MPLSCTLHKGNVKLTVSGANKCKKKGGGGMIADGAVGKVLHEYEYKCYKALMIPHSETDCRVVGHTKYVHVQGCPDAKTIQTILMDSRLANSNIRLSSYRKNRNKLGMGLGRPELPL